MITVYIKVKFRAFGITFSTVEKSVRVPIIDGIDIPPFEKVLVDERGVYLKVSA